MKIVVTGAQGLIGWHTLCHLRALNAAAQFKGEQQPFEIEIVDHTLFDDKNRLAGALSGAEAVLHFAGVNRAPEDEIETANVNIAQTLVDVCRHVNSRPHIVYANSTHASTDTPYGRSKRRAGEILNAFGSQYTNLILPHIFGECARPNYNNVTATLIDQVVANKMPTVNPEGKVSLLHAGGAAKAAISAVTTKQYGTVKPASEPMSVQQLLSQIQTFHKGYEANKFPHFENDFQVQLFNSYRAALYPSSFPRVLNIHKDDRGFLYEAVKGGAGGQCFLSWTKPGITRGNHFHLNKVERFLVVSGEAIIRIRRVLHADVWEFSVNGETPSAVDMPTLHTHSIENIGTTPLLTLFWTNEIFNPNEPDTYFDSVLKDK